MMSITLDAIALPDDLNWTDEFDWSPVAQATNHTLTGALIVEEDTRLKGRPITLQSDDAWCSRSTVEALRAKLQSGLDMTLTLHDGVVFTVRWRHNDQPITALQIVPYADPMDTDHYRIVLRFLEV